MQYKVYLLVFFVIFLISFVTGICTCAGYSADIDCSNLINKYLYSFLCRNISWFSLFLIYSVYFCLLSLFIVFLTRNLFFTIIDGAILALLSYIFGFDVCIICVCLGLSGVLLGIIIGGVLGLIIFSLIMLLISIACKRYREYHRNCIDNNTKYWAIYLGIVVVGILVFFIGCLFFSIIHLFVIVG